MTELEKVQTALQNREPIWFYGLVDPREAADIPDGFRAKKHLIKIGLVTFFLGGGSLQKSLYSRIDKFREQARASSPFAGSSTCSDSNRWLADCVEHGLTPVIQLIAQISLAPAFAKQVAGEIERGRHYSGPNYVPATKADETLLGVAAGQAYLAKALFETKEALANPTAARRRYSPAYRHSLAALTAEVKTLTERIAALESKCTTP